MVEIMGTPKHQRVLYDKEWLRDRAFNSLVKMREGAWDFSDSLLLYSPDGAAEYASIQETDTPYARMVTIPEKEYLRKVAPDIVRELPHRFEYIDLGPGSEHKEQFFFDAAKAQGKSFLYMPVDVNENFLQLSNTFVSLQGIEVVPVRASFEELPGKLTAPKSPRFVSLGLTFSNYAPGEVLRLLKSITGEEGYIFVNAQMRDRIDIQALQQAYAEPEVYKFIDPKVRLLDLNPETDISRRETDDGIRMWYTIKEVNEPLRKKGIKDGDKLLVFQSLRYEKPMFEKEISTVFPNYKLYDTGNSFCASLLRS